MATSAAPAGAPGAGAGGGSAACHRKRPRSGNSKPPTTAHGHDEGADGGGSSAASACRAGRNELAWASSRRAPGFPRCCDQAPAAMTPAAVDSELGPWPPAAGSLLVPGFAQVLQALRLDRESGPSRWPPRRPDRPLCGRAIAVGCSAFGQGWASSGNRGGQAEWNSSGKVRAVGRPGVSRPVRAPGPAEQL